MSPAPIAAAAGELYPFSLSSVGPGYYVSSEDLMANMPSSPPSCPLTGNADFHAGPLFAFADRRGAR